MNLLDHVFGPIVEIPGDLTEQYAPAQVCLFEWSNYWINFPEADRLWIGQKEFEPIPESHHFQIRFENQLGLAAIQPRRGNLSLCPPTWVQVISGKFPSPVLHLYFFQTLLSDLFRRAVNLPFTVSSPTSQAVIESIRPPTPLFTLNFLYQHGDELRTAAEIILSNPHRILTTREEKLPVYEACEVDGDVILDILKNTQDWIPTRGFQLAEELGGYAPERVWQRLPEETLDSPENRFIRHFLHQVINAADKLPGQTWWPSLSVLRQIRVREVTNHLRQILLHPLFTEVKDLFHLPLSSRVLMHREGYREMLGLWQQFHQARRPIFEPLQHAIEIRDIATLYEIWTFFRLSTEIGEILGVKPVLDFRASDRFGLEWQSEARFGAKGNLVYNQAFSRGLKRFHSYSLGLRPDFIWLMDGKPEVVLDAKFRLTFEQQDNCDLDQDESSPMRTIPVEEDLYKMHTYRDALGVRAAVSLYPGTERVFYDREHGIRREVTLKDILLGNVSGVGALPFKPNQNDQ